LLPVSSAFVRYTCRLESIPPKRKNKDAKNERPVSVQRT
jgi:hypothetical protein